MTAATKRRPRPGRTLPTEIKVLVPGHARGAAAFIAMRRKGTLWAVVDNNRGDWTADYWDGRGWKPLDEDADLAAAYQWPQKQARELADRFAAQAAEIEPHYIGLMDRAEPAEADTAATVADVKVGHLRELAAISVPAPKDVPGFGVTGQTLDETVRDTALPDLAEDGEDPQVLTGLGLGIPATTAPGDEPAATGAEEESDAEKTAVISAAQVRDLTGNGETRAMATLPADTQKPDAAVIPPMPEVPPHLEPVPRLDWGVDKEPAEEPELATSP